VERRVINDSTEESSRELAAAWWRKSTYSGVGECVVFAELGPRIALRNSNDRAGGTLFFARGALSRWIAGTKAGEFDDLTG
jgi:hypothetical protein